MLSLERQPYGSFVGSICFIASYSKCFYTRVLICSSLKLFCFFFYVVDVVCKVFFITKSQLQHAGQLCNLTHTVLSRRKLLNTVQMTFVKSCLANSLRKHYNVIYNPGNCSELKKTSQQKERQTFHFELCLGNVETLSTQRSSLPSWKCIKQVRIIKKFLRYKFSPRPASPPWKCRILFRVGEKHLRNCWSLWMRKGGKSFGIYFRKQRAFKFNENFSYPIWD